MCVTDSEESRQDFITSAISAEMKRRRGASLMMGGKMAGDGRSIRASHTETHVPDTCCGINLVFYVITSILCSKI